MKPYQILVVSEDAAQYRQLLTTLSQPVTLNCVESSQQALPYCGQSEILFGEPNLMLPLLDKMPKLRWIQSSWAGVTPLIEALRHPPRELVLTNIRGIFGPLMAEYVFAYLLGHERQLEAHRQAQQQRQWRSQRGGSLQGKTFGLLGLGSIGAHLAATARHFGMRVVGCSRSLPDEGLIDQHYLPERLALMVAEVDYLVCTLPSTEQSRNLIDAELLQQFNPRALLINAGRGDLIDDAALVDALTSGQLAGAVLDVFRQEPLATDHPFWSTPNLIITSHTAAPSYPEDIARVFSENLQRFAATEPLQYRVDIERGY
ncbi:MAG: D-2-hydroxyacid dehydrogenase [Motiliproteus sp.]